MALAIGHESAQLSTLNRQQQRQRQKQKAQVERAAVGGLGMGHKSGVWRVQSPASSRHSNWATLDSDLVSGLTLTIAAGLGYLLLLEEDNRLFEPLCVCN